MEKTITVNLLLIKNTLFQCLGQDTLSIGGGRPVLSPAKPARQSDEGSKKTPLAALREARLGCNPWGACTCSQLENPKLGHAPLPFLPRSLPVKKDPENCAELPETSVTHKPHGFGVQLTWSNEEARE